MVSSGRAGGDVSDVQNDVMFVRKLRDTGVLGKKEMNRSDIGLGVSKSKKQSNNQTNTIHLLLSVNTC